MFLRGLDELSFGAAADDPHVFVDELLLPARSEDDRGGSPDQAVLWPQRVWLIELKTEPGSHRADQLPMYYELAHHHFPGTRVDVTYLTPAMPIPAPATVEPDRYAHVSWDQVAPLVERGWGRSADELESRVAAVLLRAIEQMSVPAPGWRDRLVDPTVPVPPGTPSAHPTGGPPAPPGDARDSVALALVHGWDTALQVAEDGRQRVAACPSGSLDDLLALRQQLRDRIRAEGVAAVRHVRPWLWNQATSGGEALSDEGRVRGFEVRLSRYAQPVS